jgi:hypothetical protein
MRLRFISQWEPLHVRRCLGAFRLHMESKTCSAPETYGPEMKVLRAEYSEYLTASEIKQWKKEAKLLEASKNELAAWEALKQKDVPQARKLAIRQVMKRTGSPASWKVLACALRGH